jgi:Putative peptidoglycan-binding domain-containing protein
VKNKLKKLSLFLVMLLAFAVMPSSSFAMNKSKKPAPKKVVVKKAVKSLPAATIKAAQQALSKDGLYKGKIDGMIGPMTTNAVKAFQKKEGLKVDGIIGPKTLKALGVK